ncbi:MAG: YHS domain-containing protein [Candidatus Electrothrix sp. YB6]
MRIIKPFGLAVFCFFMLLSFAGSALAAPQTTCPVMGGKINKEIYADYQGQRVYFCCAACLPKFNEDPETYLAKMQEMGQEPEAVPVAGDDAAAAPAEPANHEGHAEHAN